MIGACRPDTAIEPAPLWTTSVIDIHVHIWSERCGLKVLQDNVESLWRMIDRYDLEAVVLMPLFGGQTPNAEQVAAGNRAAHVISMQDRRVKPFVTVYPPLGKSAEDELERGVNDYGCHGMKVWVSPVNTPEMYRLVERMIDFDKPMLIHAMHKSVGQYALESDPVDIAKLARQYPQARIIMAHMGGNFIYSCGAIRDLPNVMVDPSGSYCEQGMVEHAVRELGVDRILFGSDAPGADFVNNLAKVMAANISDNDKAAIMYGNARKLLS